jgi:hypothetical protein
MIRLRRCRWFTARAAAQAAFLLAATLVLGQQLVSAQQPPAAAPPPPPPPVRVVGAADIPVASSNSAAAALDQRIIDEAAKHSEIIANLTYLSDDIGARLTGSANLKRANEWTADKMREYGLENVHLEPWSIPARWERGPATARMVEPDNGRTLLIASNGWTPGTNGKIVGDVVVINAQKKEDLEAYKGKLKGAIVLMSPPATIRPISETNRGPTGPWSDGGGRGGRRGAGAPPGGSPVGGPPVAPPANAAPPGAPANAGGPPGQRMGRGDFVQRMALMREMNDILRKEGAAMTLRDAGKPQMLLTVSGGWRDEERANAAEPLPSAFVAHEHYAMLYRLASRPAPAKTRVEIEIKNTLTPGPHVVYNTVGEVRGKEKPDEVVILGAHLDSWDLAQGSTDNGTGSCVVLEAARIVGKLAKEGVQPRRTIRFILFSGEEQGLKGSAAYVKQHKDEMAKISMCLVHDTGTGKVIGIGLQNREVIKPIFDREMATLARMGVDFNMRSMGATDHASFDRVGVPGFAVQQDSAEYFLSHHSQSDTLDKAKEPDLIQGAEVLAVAAVRVANLDSLLPRDRKENPDGGFGGRRRGG